jgi:hypothetical protein
VWRLPQYAGQYDARRYDAGWDHAGTVTASNVASAASSVACPVEAPRLVLVLGKANLRRSYRCQRLETQLRSNWKTLTPRGASGFFFALEPLKESGIGGYMPSYIVTAYCEKCSANHPTGVELNWPEQIPPNKSIKEVFDGTFLPPEIAMMSRNYFLCPQTGKINKQTDSTKTSLAEMK